ncbi:hypothetical protein GCM10011519_22870 [Marmoricola endophyticus]|uniref:MOSC domain-containing protein n=1 Tax=Marmoricola endophyticus TaxID=2040280 RepID=A0A917F368_9ACTN|nr:MOSC N-terminal beta barrel domain-containing protein [Marmoricola endophyticus]GGF48309.1 hypothetical protein GCM10011519_22870 [Marmoricola endophyticus]
MLVSRLGLTPLKGARHVALPSVELGTDGPVGDRVFCLVDPEGRDGGPRVLRTVENPRLPALRASYDGTALSVLLPDGTVVEGAPHDTGTELKSDYWGRDALLVEQDGPFAEAIGAWLGRRVVLARAAAGDVVYGGPVTVVTTGDLHRLGLEGQDARFRATVTLDTDRRADSFAPGSRLQLGAAVLEVRGAVPRCAVVDLDPTSGERDARVLTSLPVVAGEPTFGLDARVSSPGQVHVGDRAVVG